MTTTFRWNDLNGIEQTVTLHALHDGVVDIDSFRREYYGMCLAAHEKINLSTQN